MKRILISALVAMSFAGGAQAESLAFTASPTIDLPIASEPTYSTFGYCGHKGLCAETITYTTTSGGTLRVTATDGPHVDLAAYAYKSNLHNAGLGVASGYFKKSGTFQVVDANFSIDERKEKLVMTFDGKIKLESLVIFPDDRLVKNVTRELDRFDGFTVSVDGAPPVEYKFKTGNKVVFDTPLVGNKFTFGYAIKASPEDYYIGGITISPDFIPD